MSGDSWQELARAHNLAADLPAFAPLSFPLGGVDKLAHLSAEDRERLRQGGGKAFQRADGTWVAAFGNAWDASTGSPTT